MTPRRIKLEFSQVSPKDGVKVIYHRNLGDGVLLNAPLDWDDEIYKCLWELGCGRISEVTKRILSDRVRSWLLQCDWVGIENLIHVAKQEERRVRLEFVSSAPELYSLPIALATVEPLGASIADLDFVDLVLKAPRTQAVPLRKSAPRLLFAWAGDVAAEQHRGAFECPLLNVEEVPNASFCALQGELNSALAAGNPFTYIHLLAHREIDAEGVGVRLADGLWDASRIQELLAPFTESLELVVFATCAASAATTNRNTQQSIGFMAHKRGVRAVLAPSFPLTTRGSVILARALYRPLPDASIEEAVSAARKALRENRCTADALGLQLLMAPLGEESDEQNEASRRHVALLERTETYLSSYVRPLLGGESIPRRATDEVIEALTGEHRCVWLEGTPGAGKSAVVRQVIERAKRKGWPALALRVDEIEREALEAHDIDLVQVLSVLAQATTAPGLVIVDQLDAVSTISGQRTELFARVKLLLNRVRLYPMLRILMVCRGADRQGDSRLKEFHATEFSKTVLVEKLTREEVGAALKRMGCDASSWGAATLDLLSTPLFLHLFEKSRGGDVVTDPPSSAIGLFQAYWTHQRGNLRTVQERDWVQAIRRVCCIMERKQQLDCSLSLLENEGLGNVVQFMCSQGIVVLSGPTLRFFHQSFFDYAWVRTCLPSGPLEEWVCASDQGLFQRAQLRWALLYRRAEDPRKFAVELNALLRSPKVRRHLKQKIVDTLSVEVVHPSSAEVRVVRGLIEDEDEDTRRLGRAVIWDQAAWMNALTQAGVLSEWLKSSDADLSRFTGRFLAVLVEKELDSVMNLLEGALNTEGPLMPSVVEFFLRLRPRASGSRLDSLAVRLIDAGCFDYPMDGDSSGLKRVLWWSSTRTAGTFCAPTVVLAALARLPYAMREGNPFLDIQLDNDSLLRVLDGVESVEVIRLLLPTVLDIIRRPGRPSRSVEWDILWSDFAIGRTSRPNAAAVVIVALRRAFARLVQHAPVDAFARINELSPAHSLTVRWLIWCTWIAVAEREPNRASDLAESFLASLPPMPLVGKDVLDNAAYALLARCAASLTHDQVRRLTDRAVRDNAPLCTHEWAERRSRIRWLHALGRDQLDADALAWLQSQDATDADTEGCPSPASPECELEPIFPGRIFAERVRTSPISVEAARGLDDDAWIAVMHDFSADRESPLLDGVGGASELAGILAAIAETDVDRFLCLGKRMDERINPRYLLAVLRPIRNGSVDATEERSMAVDRLAHRVLGRAPAALIREFMGIVRDSPQWPWTHKISEAVADFVTGRRVARDDALPVFDHATSVAIHSARQAAMGAVGALLAGDRDRLPLLRGAIEVGVLDPAIDVRRSAVLSCIATVGGDDALRELGLAWFKKLNNSEHAVVIYPEGMEYLWYALSFAGLDLHPLVKRMVDAPRSDVAMRGGHFAVQAVIHSPVRVDALMAFAHECAHHDRPEVRRGVAEALAVNLDAWIGRAELMTDWNQWLRDFFSDADTDIQQVACRWLWRLKPGGLMRHQQLVTSLISSPAFDWAESILLEVLESEDHRIPELTLLACEASCERASAKGSSIWHDIVPRLLVRGLRELEPDDPQRLRWLDVLDRAVAMSTIDVDEALRTSDEREVYL